MAPLSSCHVSGVFSLSGGSRNTEPSYYARYLSALEFTDDNKFINVSVRKFTPSADVLYADNSFVFMVAKAALPAGEDGMLDSLHCTLFESTPEDFESSLPPEPTHTMFVTGTVGSIDSSGPMRSFVLTTSEYVRDERRTFDIRSVSFLRVSGFYIAHTFTPQLRIRWRFEPLEECSSTCHRICRHGNWYLSRHCERWAWRACSQLARYKLWGD